MMFLVVEFQPSVPIKKCALMCTIANELVKRYCKTNINF